MTSTGALGRMGRMGGYTSMSTRSRARRGGSYLRAFGAAVVLVASAATGTAGAVGETEPVSATSGTVRSTPEIAASAAFDITTVGQGFLVIFDVAVAADGSSYVAGQFQGELAVGAGAAAVNLESAQGAGFVAGFDADNQARWAQLAGSAATAVEVDGTGIVGVTGTFSGVGTFGSGPTAVNLTARGDADAFLARYRSDGALEWALRAGGPSQGLVPFGCEVPRDIGNSVGFGPAGEMYMVGGVTGAATFSGTGGTSASVAAAPDNINGFFASYSPTGQIGDVVLVEGAQDTLLTALGIDASGNVAVTGFVRGSGSLGGATIDATAGTAAFVAVLDGTGSTEWLATVDGAAPKRPDAAVCGSSEPNDLSQWPTDIGVGLDISPDGSSIVTLTEVVGSVTFENLDGADQTSNSQADDREVAVASYTIGGALEWTARASSSEEMLGGAVVATTDGGAVATGYFRTAASFGDVDLAGVGDTTMFVAAYGPDGDDQWSEAIDGSADGFSVGFAVTTTVAGNVIAAGKGAGVVVDPARDGAGSERAFRVQFGDAVAFEPIVPIRVVDSRNQPTAVDGEVLERGPVPGKSVISVKVAGIGQVPAGVDALMLNVTAVETAEAGYASVYPCGTEPPTSSNLNYPAGATVPVAAITAVAPDGSICLFVDQTAQYLIDVTGYVAAGFGPITPKRLLDQRELTPDIAGRGDVISVDVSSVVPDDATAVAVMVTGVEARTAGFATVDDCSGDALTAETSNLNLGLGETRSNSVVTSMSADREVCINVDGEASYLLDVAGWFAGGYVPVTPERLLDTRNRVSTVDGEVLERGPVPAGSVIEVQITGRADVPAAAVGVALNLTVVDPEQPGYATIFDCAGPVPVASNLNYGIGGAVANGAYVGLSETGSVCIFTDQTGHYLADVTGWFTSG